MLLYCGQEHPFMNRKGTATPSIGGSRKLAIRGLGSMSKTRSSFGRSAGDLTSLAIVAVCILLAIGAVDTALAQGGPFGTGRPSTPPPELSGGIIGWIMAKQAQFYQAMSGAIRAAKSDGSALYGLLGISFAYGVFHAAGPGHGKAVISSRLVANEETWRRGVVLSFASAMPQALVAVAIVGIGAILLGGTAKMMGDAVRVIETASYLLIIAVGTRLMWVKGRGFLSALGTMRAEPKLAPAGAAVTPVDHPHKHDHDHRHHDHHDHDHHHDDHDHHHDHGHAHHHHDGEACG